MASASEFKTLPSAMDLDIDIENLEVPEGMAISVFPPTQEYMRDPIWFDQVGRDPIDQRKIFELSSRDEMKEKLVAILKEWPRYGPAIYEKAARQGRLDVVEILLELGAESDPKTMKERKPGDEDEDIPLLDVEHAYLEAIIEGHFDIAKLLVERGVVPIDYEAGEEGLVAIVYAATKGHVEIVRWLLENGATITFVREGEGINDIEASVKGGNTEIARMVLDNPQTVAAGRKVEMGNIKLAAFSGSAEMVRFVLQSDCFGIQDPDAGFAGRGEIQLSAEQVENIENSLYFATEKGALESVKLLLSQLTAVRPDGSFEPYRLPDSVQSQVFNGTGDALEHKDIPVLYEVLWDTVLHQPPESEDSIEKRIAIPPQERLNRRLITASTTGRLGTAKLVIERYGTEVNHISHKYFTSPLSRAAASGAVALPGRLEVAEYLLRLPNIDIDLSVGEYCNGETALALAVREANVTARKGGDQSSMVRLLLSHGGPVEEVDLDLHNRCEAAVPGEKFEVHVLWAEKETRSPVRLSLRGSDECWDVVLYYTAHELRDLVQGVKIRKRDALLQTSDRGGRPLMPGPGEADSTMDES